MASNTEMSFTNLLDKMVSPNMKREGKPLGGVIQIHLTRSCNLSCFGCTQGSNLAGKLSFMSLENFEKAVDSLQDYFGIVGIFGGNPCLHPKFKEICEIAIKYIPQQRLGLWSNNLNGHGAICRKTFNPAVSNLNVHLVKEAYTEMARDWPESRPFGLHTDSRHSPVYTALKDLIKDEQEQFRLISNCDINKHWSAMIAEFRGELRGYFCEIAAAQSILHQNNPDYPDTGVEVNKTWWKNNMDYFSSQVKKHCFDCGVPLRGYGELAQQKEELGIEYVTKTHEDIYKTKRNRRIELVTINSQIQPNSLDRMTNYLQNSNK